MHNLNSSCKLKLKLQGPFQKASGRERVLSAMRSSKLVQLTAFGAVYFIKSVVRKATSVGSWHACASWGEVLGAYFAAL